MLFLCICVIRCGGITISGVGISPTIRKKNLETPLLESYKFIPNFAELDLHISVRVNAQIILENTLTRKFKAIEIIDEFTDDNIEILTPIIKLYLLQDEPLDVDVDVADKKLDTETDCLLVIASKIINRPEVGLLTYIY